MCIYSDDGNRLHQRVSGVDGLGDDDKLVLIVYRADAAYYRCWNLEGNETNEALEK